MAQIRKREGKRGTTYTAVIRKAGFKDRVATFATKKAAESWAKKEEGKLVDCRYDPSLAAGDHTVAELIDDYIETKNLNKTQIQSRRLDWWRDRLGQIKLAVLTRHHIKNAIDEYRDGNVIKGGHCPKETSKRRRPATINRQLAAISAVLTYAMHDKEWIEVNPARMVKRLQEDNEETRFLRDHEIDALRVACKAQYWDRLWLLVVMGINTGARLGELLRLRWSDIAWQDNIAIASLGTTKSGKPRQLVIVGEAFDELKAQREKDRDPKIAHLLSDDRLIFPGAKDPSKPYAAHNDHWKRAREACGLWAPGDKEKHVKFHTTRHTAASHLVQNGVDLYTVQKVLGHTTGKVTQRYAHLELKQQIDAVTAVFGKKERQS